MVTSMVWAGTTSQTSTSTTKENSECQTWRDEESKSGQMVDAMKEISKTEKRTEKVHSSGPQESSTSAVGGMGNSTEWAYCTIRTTIPRSKVSGRTESVSDGSQV